MILPQNRPARSNGNNFGQNSDVTLAELQKYRGDFMLDDDFGGVHLSFLSHIKRDIMIVLAAVKLVNKFTKILTR